MVIDSVARLVEILREYQLLDTEQLKQIARVLPARLSEPQALSKEIKRRGWLSDYQVEQIFEGHGRQLRVGPYRILDRLGEGAISQVYHAWDTHHERAVALKVVRPELLSNVEAVSRFRREIKVVSRLDHPNIVKAFDANLDGDTLYYAMEYVEGIDLAQLVHQSGPLAIRLACEYTLQAALGLQHAYEQGLIHRDIKPANLIVTLPKETAGNGPGVVKIVDLGLARLQRAAGQSDSGHNLTKEGVMIGTADYMAPEQARSPRTVDIRADIYSLGCTFYFLLAGQPPYPGKSLMQKLLDHQGGVASPVEFIRPAVPRALTLVVKKMMAKKPEERYATPAQVADALAPFCRTDPLSKPRPPANPA